jgi:8-oxo-dGTP pyrophosphatase MutT (NUDIX family)
MIPLLSDGTLIFTERTAQLRHHPGQICFPGGSLELGESGQAAALREGREEIGVRHQGLRWLGRLDDAFSPRGFHIECHLAFLEDQPFEAHSPEVAAIHRVPLDLLLESGRHRVDRMSYPGFAVHHFELPSLHIWGVTGAMVHNLARLLGAESQP